MRMQKICGENGHRRETRRLDVTLIHENLLVARVRVSAGQQLLVELERLYIEENCAVLNCDNPELNPLGS